MMITCLNCNKKFNINNDLIPDKGRLLQCGSCNHKWFFKKYVIPELIEPIKNENFEIFEPKKIKEKKALDDDIDLNNVDKTSFINNVTNKKPSTKYVKNKTTVLNLTIVFIISFIALIILIDTFEYPLSIIFPNIEYLLYNLYESIKDIILFVKDLI